MGSRKQEKNLHEKSETTVDDALSACLSDEGKRKHAEINIIVDKFKSDMERLGAAVFMVAAIEMDDHIKIIKWRDPGSSIHIMATIARAFSQELEKPELAAFMALGKMYRDFNNSHEHGK